MNSVKVSKKQCKYKEWVDVWSFEELIQYHIHFYKSKGESGLESIWDLEECISVKLLGVNHQQGIIPWRRLV